MSGEAEDLPPPGGVQVIREWTVAWFPHDGPDETRTYAREAKARDRYAVALELGHAPVMTERVIETRVVSEKIVANATGWGVEP